MKIGATLPQIEIGSDPGAIREYAQAVEEMGYDHIGAYDHVLGADPSHYPDWRGPYTHQSMFHEPFVLYGYLAAVTNRLELVTQIIILPQRQTALVAKQAAEVDILSGGRLRLGVGIGWNWVEYEALGKDFRSRGRRSEEQVALLRALWTQDVVTFEGRWESVTASGINPPPVQRPIPIWFGGGAAPVLERIAHVGDGWFPQGRPTDEAVRERIARMRSLAIEAGRDPTSIGVQGGIGIGNTSEEEWAATLAAWRDLGASHIGVNTMGAGFASVDQHLDALRRFYAVARG